LLQYWIITDRMKARVLESQRLVYRPVSLAHLGEEYVSWLNDPEVIRYMEAGGNQTLEMLEAFLREVEKKDILFWGIHLKSDGKHIGNIKIDPVNEKHGLGEYGIMMGDRKEWSKGYAREATVAIINYCFKEVGLRKITLGVVANNKAAHHLYESIGFIEEGRYKDHVFCEGVLCDVIRMAIFNPVRQA
jgi:[ribosomal protein S5]-alanine N-acetyltransferase